MKNYSIIAIALLISCFIVCFESSTVLGAYSPNLSSTGQTETTITLSWTQSDDWAFTNYNVTYATSPDGPFQQYRVITDKTKTTLVISGLTPDSDYYFIVYDTGSLVGTAPSNPLHKETKASPLLEVTDKTSSTVSLKWINYNWYSTQAPFQKYVISMSTNGGQWSTLTTLTDPYLTTYAVTGLSPGTYSFQISDYVGAAGQLLGVSQSNVATAKLVEPLSVNIPTPFNTTIISGQQLQLDAYTTGGTGAYYYQWYLDGTQITGGASTYTYSPTDADMGTSHRIYAQVSDGDGTTATSNYISLYVPVTIEATLLPYDATPIPTGQIPNPTNTTLPDTANNGNGTMGLLIVGLIVMGVIIIGVIVLIKRPKTRLSSNS